MEADRFDTLVRTLVERASRRTLLGASLASLVAGLGMTDAGARKKHKKHKRRKGSNCPNGCPPGAVCLGGACVVREGSCPAGADSCGATDTVRCNANPKCSCYVRMEGGTRCGQENFTLGSACDQCGTDADCLALGFPTGSSCILDSGITCDRCRADDRGECVEPCGSGAGSCPVGADSCTGVCPGDAASAAAIAPATRPVPA